MRWTEIRVEALDLDQVIEINQNSKSTIERKKQAAVMRYDWVWTWNSAAEGTK